MKPTDNSPAASPVLADGHQNRKVKVYLAVAGHFASNDVLFVQSMMALTIRPLVTIQFGWSCDPSVERARNILTQNFLESDCTHILFVDADIGFASEDVARIASHNEGVVGGLYPLKNQDPTVKWCLNALEPSPAPTPEGLQQVKYIGTGFLCVRRDVFERIADFNGYLLDYRQDFPPHRIEHAYWRQGVAGRRFLTEDWMFCHLCHQIGIPVFADTGVVLKHAGRAEWPLPHQAGNPFAPVSTGPATDPNAPRTS